jgi:type IV secretion system protein VirB10
MAGDKEGAPAATVIYPLRSAAQKSQVAGYVLNVMTKWEGDALLSSIIVSGPENYSLMERWSRSRDGGRLTVSRTLVRASGETESILVYKSPTATITSASPQPAPPPDSMRERASGTAFGSARRPVTNSPQEFSPRADAAPPSEYVVPAGTRVLLRLTNSVNTKRTAVGDRVYLQTVAPVFVGGHLVVPKGSDVIGTVTESARAGRVKGKSALNIRFDSLTLPNGVTRDFRSRAGSVDTQGNLDRSEGRIQGEGTKGKDAATVGKTTAAGAGIGSIAGAISGNAGMGAGIGAAAGAVAGLAGVFGSRGADVVIPQGTTMEMVLDRELRFTSAELPRRDQ